MTSPSDADMEHLRRAMVDARETWDALRPFSGSDLGDDGDAVSKATADAYRAAARAYVAAKRARGGL